MGANTSLISNLSHQGRIKKITDTTIITKRNAVLVPRVIVAIAFDAEILIESNIATAESDPL